MFANASLKQLFTMMVLAAAGRQTATSTTSNPLIPRLPKPPVSRKYPQRSEGERVRRMGQILQGTHRRENGLVDPGQLISRPNGTMQVQRPY